MEVWDKGVFMNELLKQSLVLRTDQDDNTTLAAKGRLAEGTYQGTQLTLTEIHIMSVEAYLARSFAKPSVTNQSLALCSTLILEVSTRFSR